MAEFSLHFFDNILELHNDLKNKTYIHGGYQAFKINDPKPHDIHKASVADRLVHHAIYRIMYPHFDTKFIYDSYSCRIGKGTHKAIQRFRYFSQKVSKNNTKTCWVLKCDIKKFFASIDHRILKDILEKHIRDKDTLRLIENIVEGFSSSYSNLAIAEIEYKGLPLGNLTSQLLVNIYMNEFDHFMKRELKVKYYIRYADDFVVLNESKEYLEKLLPKISKFLGENLKLVLHPDKVFIKTLASGVDFLGWVEFGRHRVLRTATKRRMWRKMGENLNKAQMASYVGMLQHGNGYRIKLQINKIFQYKESLKSL